MSLLKFAIVNAAVGERAKSNALHEPLEKFAFIIGAILQFQQSTSMVPVSGKFSLIYCACFQRELALEGGGGVDQKERGRQEEEYRISMMYDQ